MADNTIVARIGFNFYTLRDHIIMQCICSDGNCNYCIYKRCTSRMALLTRSVNIIAGHSDSTWINSHDDKLIIYNTKTREIARYDYCRITNNIYEVINRYDSVKRAIALIYAAVNSVIIHDIANIIINMLISAY